MSGERQKAKESRAVGSVKLKQEEYFTSSPH